MNKIAKIVVVAGLVIIVGTVIVLKEYNKLSSANNIVSEESERVPRLVDLGAGKCVACKMMEPVLDELKREYAGRLKVDFFDVWKNPDIAKKYGVEIIPTQILFDSSGKELFRHEGFFSKEDILAKFEELGVNIEKNK